MPGKITAKFVVPTLAAVTAAALMGAPPAAAGPVAATVGATASAALIVGGTSFPTLEQSFMQQLWPTWATSLGLANDRTPSLINVAYPAELYPFTNGEDLGTSVASGVDNLLGLIATTYSSGEHLIVWGISQGALVLDAAQRLLANDPSAPPPGSLTFVRVADPAAAVTGMLNFLPNLIMSEVLHLDGSLRTAPNDSQYDTIVVTNEYDAFADFPDRPWNALAVANAIMGLWYRHGQTGGVDLTGVPAQNISTTVNTQGATVTTYLVPAPLLPLTQPLRDAGVSPGVVDKLDRVLRPIIEAGYSRNQALLSPSDTAAAKTPAPAEPEMIPPGAKLAAAAGESSPRPSIRTRNTARAATTAAVAADRPAAGTTAGRHQRRGR